MRTPCAFVIIGILCSCCCQAQVAPTQQFLGSLWAEKFGLGDAQTLNASQFETVLSDLRIGAYYNDSAGCPAVSTPGSDNATAGVNACLSSAALARLLGYNLTAGLTRQNFSNFAVAAVQQQLTGRCLVRTDGAGSSEGNSSTSGDRDKKWAYIYGTVSVTVISLLSCAGSLLASCRRAPRFQYLLLFLVELAVGSLVGEVLLHLLPTVVQNGHEEHAEGGGGGGRVLPPSFPKLVAAAAAICVLHAVDTGSTVGGLEGHSHDVAETAEMAAAQPNAAYLADADGEATAAATSEKSPNAPAESAFSFTHARVRLWDLARSPKRCLRNPVRLCLFVMVSDALHNFADGVAIGAAFALGDQDGLRLSLTVGLHELAHELADFAVLLSCGFSVGAAVFVNFLCTFTCFVGLYVAIPLTQVSSEVQIWILAVAAAMFLYIALVTLTNLVRSCYRPRSVTAFIAGNLGLVAGFLSVIAISLYEIYG